MRTNCHVLQAIPTTPNELARAPCGAERVYLRGDAGELRARRLGPDEANPAPILDDDDSWVGHIMETANSNTPKILGLCNFHRDKYLRRSVLTTCRAGDCNRGGAAARLGNVALRIRPPPHTHLKKGMAELFHPLLVKLSYRFRNRETIGAVALESVRSPRRVSHLDGMRL